MASLICVNGPPAIGKSTIAALYAERHPGTLNLDIDRLHTLVGGWRDEGNRTHDVLRPVALAMAAAHLRGGRDVIVPQYLTRADEIEAFEHVAHHEGATFREIVLMDELAGSIDRFEQREDVSEWELHNRRLVARHGGSALLASLYRRFLDVLPLRPRAVVIRSELNAIEDTYAQLLQAVEAGR